MAATGRVRLRSRVVSRTGTRLASLAFAALTVAAAAPACSQGEGQGRIQGTLDVPDCWTGSFDLSPDFFAAAPYRRTMLLRIQSGSDFETFSDGIAIMIRDIDEIRPDASAGRAGRYGEPLRVDLPPGVTPPGTPVEPDPTPPLVSMSLYLQRSCRTESVALYAVDEVTVLEDGTCTAPPMKGADPWQGCDPERDAPAGLGPGRSAIAFTSLANGKVDEETASERLNAGCFDVYLADPREATPGGPPPPCRGRLRGSFSFLFERGRPSQAFP